MGQADQGVEKSVGRYQVVPRTLCFVQFGNEVLMLKGAPTKRIWPGRYNGVGGHVERNEDIRAAAQREILEETGLRVNGLRLRAVVNIDAGQPVGIVLFVFTADALGRETTASPEGSLEWVQGERLLELDLVEDLPLLLPRILALSPNDGPLFAHYGYDEQDHLVVEIGE